MLESYQRYLYHYRKPNGDPLSFRSQSQRLLPERAFFRWAARSNHVLYNPASEIELPKVERRLTKPALTAAETEQVLATCDPVSYTHLDVYKRQRLEMVRGE